MSRAGKGTLASLSSLGTKGSAWSVSEQSVDQETEMADWFVAHLPRDTVRDIAVKLLKEGEPGNFIVRSVKSEPDAYGLSIKSSGGQLLNYLIERVRKPRGTIFKIRGTKDTFDTVADLIYFFADKRRPELGIRLNTYNDFLHDDFRSEDSYRSRSGSDLSEDEDRRGGGKGKSRSKAKGGKSRSKAEDRDRDADSGDERPEKKSAKPKKAVKFSEDVPPVIRVEEPRVEGSEEEGLGDGGDSSSQVNNDEERWKRNAEEEYSRSMGRAAGEKAKKKKKKKAAAPADESGGEERVVEGYLHVDADERDSMSKRKKGSKAAKKTHPAPVLMATPDMLQQNMMGLTLNPGVAAANISLAGDPESRIQAVEAQLMLMRAETELAQARLRAAETTLAYYKQEADAESEAKKYERQAAAFALKKTPQGTALLTGQAPAPAPAAAASSNSSASAGTGAGAGTEEPKPKKKTASFTAVPGSATPVTAPKKKKVAVQENPKPSGEDLTAGAAEAGTFEKPKLKKMKKVKVAEPAAAAAEAGGEQVPATADTPAPAPPAKSPDRFDPDAFMAEIEEQRRKIEMEAQELMDQQKKKDPMIAAIMKAQRESVGHIETQSSPGPALSAGPSPMGGKPLSRKMSAEEILQEKLNKRKVIVPPKNVPPSPGAAPLRPQEVQIDFEKQKRELDRMAVMEKEEMRRRKEFDEGVSRRATAAKLLAYKERQVELLQIDLLEIEEQKRRKEWDKAKEEREAKILMNAPNASDHLLEYLRDQEQLEEERERQRKQQEEETRQVVREGQVLRFASLFEAGTAPPTRPTTLPRKPMHL